MSRQISPQHLVLKCYGQQMSDGNWYGVCLNLNLSAEARSSEELKAKLYDIIVSYIETILDTEDIDSVPALLYRPAPIYDWLTYYFIKLMLSIRNFPNNTIFKQFIPFHLANQC